MGVEPRPVQIDILIEGRVDPRGLAPLQRTGLTTQQIPHPATLFSFFFFFFNKFIYFILLFIFGCVGSSSLRAGPLQSQRAGATLRRGARASHCGGFSCWGARALGVQASVVVACRLSSCGSRAPERRLSSCAAWAQLLCSVWDLPGPGLKPVPPALAGGFLTTAPPGKPLRYFLCLESRSYVKEVVAHGFLWTLSWRGTALEPKCLLWERSSFKSWSCHPMLSRYCCLLQRQPLSSVLTECWAKQCEISLCLLPSCTFLCSSFPHSCYCLPVHWCCHLVFFCFNLVWIVRPVWESWVSLFWACTSGMWSLGLDLQFRNSVSLPWTWFNGCSGRADLWPFLSMFDLSKQTAVIEQLHFTHLLASSCLV